MFVKLILAILASQALAQDTSSTANTVLTPTSVIDWTFSTVSTGLPDVITATFTTLTTAPVVTPSSAASTETGKIHPILDGGAWAAKELAQETSLSTTSVATPTSVINWTFSAVNTASPEEITKTFSTTLIPVIATTFSSVSTADGKHGAHGPGGPHGPRGPILPTAV